MVQVTRSVELAAAPSEVWAVIGGFDALPDWHPGIDASAREDQGGVAHRRLTLGNGAQIVEKDLGSSTMSYGYEMVDPGPLPLRGYRSVIAVAPAGAGSVVVWNSVFDTTGDEAGATELVAGVYEAGLGALAERFGG